MRRFCSVRREGLAELRDWLDSFWGDALEAFKREAEKPSSKKSKEPIMSPSIAIEPMRKSVRVEAPNAHAFEVFTSGLNRWWPPNHGIGKRLEIAEEWKPDISMTSEVDVRFTAEGTNGTRVELVHHKSEGMGAEAGTSLRKDVNGGWPSLIERFAREAERGSTGMAP